MGASHLVLFGHFGVGNIGNDTTLEAMLYNIRRYQPAATVTCVCRGPRGIADRFGIAALPVDSSEDRMPGESPKRQPGLLTKVFMRVLDELAFWGSRPFWFRAVDQFIVVGTGVLHDGGAPPWNMPYDLFKWCWAAKLGGAKVVFLSIGAGPIVHPVSRWLMLNALRQASYRSYRDQAAFAYLQSVDFDTSADQLYPDLVFSLPPTVGIGAPVRNGQPKRIGLGVIAYYGPDHDTIGGQHLYRAYVDQLKKFVHWLLSQGYHVRLLTGDLENDPQPAHELLAFVRNEGLPAWQTQICAEPITTVDDLSRQIAATDLVVVSRFHNLVGALQLERPALSVGFHAKNDALMAEMGLQAYCQHIETLDVDRLIEQFEALVAELPQAIQRIQRKNADYRQRLHEQYCRLLDPTAENVPTPVPLESQLEA